MIPKQLQKPEFRFCLLKKKEKVPFENKWQEKGYAFDDPKLLKHIKNGGNYGVIGGYGNLRIIDCDKKEFVNKIGKVFNTFKVRTGGGGTHIYIISDYDTNHVFTESRGELRAKNYQVVGPGSQHPNGMFYEVIQDTEIMEISKKGVEIVIGPYLRKSSVEPSLDNKTEDTDKSRSGREWAEVCRLIDLNYDKEQIFEKMTAFAKWSFAPPQYKEMTYEKALKQKKGSGTTKENIIQLMIINKKKEAAELLANIFLKEHRVYTTRSDKNPEVWIYQEGIYVPEGITTIKEYIDNILNENYTTYFINQVSEKIKIRSYIKQEELFKETHPEYLIPVKNGILNLKSGQLMDFDPKYKFFAKLPIYFDENAECHECKKFFNEVLGSKEDITIMQEIFGFALLREYKYHHVFIFEGIGRNGKSVTLNLLKSLVGIENCSEVSIDDLSNNEFAKVSLHKKLINISGDIGKNAITNSNILKSMSGEDLQEANRKFLETIKFTNYAKLIFGLNELPRTYDRSDAFYDRIILINYPMKFVDEKDVDEEKENYKLRDPNIIKKITTQQELSGLLNWAIEGFKRLEKQGFFSYNKSTEQIKKMYIRKSNSFEAYCNENLVFGEGRTEKNLIRKDYVNWCKQNNLGRPKGDKTVKGVMEYNGAYQDRIQEGSERTWYWIDVQRKTDIAEEEEVL